MRRLYRTFVVNKENVLNCVTNRSETARRLAGVVVFDCLSILFNVNRHIFDYA